VPAPVAHGNTAKPKLPRINIRTPDKIPPLNNKLNLHLGRQIARFTHMKSKKKEYPYPTRAANVPVTQRMLYAVRDELKSDINGLRVELKSEMKSIEAKVETRFHELSSQIHQIKILAEEQNAKNNIVLDGLVNLFERQDRLESR